MAIRGIGGRAWANGKDFKGACPVERKFLLEDFVIREFPRSLSYGGSGVVNPHPSAGYVSGTAEEGVGESRVSTVDAGDRQGVLFPHKFVRSLLAFAGEVAVRELVAVEALVSTTV